MGIKNIPLENSEGKVIGRVEITDEYAEAIGWSPGSWILTSLVDVDHKKVVAFVATDIPKEPTDG